MRARQLLLETALNSVVSITGTANQVIASANVGAVTLSLPQSIATSSDVQFGSVSVTKTQSGTSGTVKSISDATTFQDGGTTSTTLAVSLLLTPTINYTAASKTGKVNIVRLAPTLTSQPSGNNAGIVFSNAFASSTFPAMKFHNQSDEDTNAEWAEFGWHVSANFFTMRTTFSGAGAARTFQINYCASSSQAIQVGGTTASVFVSANSLSAAIAQGRLNVGLSTQTATSGTHATIVSQESFSPSSTSTMSAYGLFVNPTINYSNGTPGAGQVYGLYVKTVNTALPTGINAGIALSSTTSALTGALLFHNQTDEVTNTEYVSQKFTSNVWTVASVKTGSGTLRGLCFGASGNSIGFYGVTPAARPSAYTLTATVVTSRTLLANASATVGNCNSVIAQMIQDLQAVGLLQ